MAIAVAAPFDIADFNIYAALPSDFSLAASSTTMQNVTGLSVPVAANAIYWVDAVLAASNAAGTVEDINYGFSFPAGAALLAAGMGGTTGGVTGNNATDMFIPYGFATSGVGFCAFGASPTPSVAFVRGQLTTTGTAGTLQVMAAQNTSGVNVTKIHLGSRILLQRVA